MAETRHPHCIFMGVSRENRTPMITVSWNQFCLVGSRLGKGRSVPYFRLPPRSRWELCSSGLLRTV